MKLTLGDPVTSLKGALGEFFLGRETLGGTAGQEIGTFPVFHQRLRSSAYYVAFDPGSHTHHSDSMPNATPVELFVMQLNS